jgi:FAD/FMN-containing dehydrogenase
MQVIDVQAPAPGLEALRAQLGDLAVISDPMGLRRKSRDFFWFSPILKTELEGRHADLIVLPKTRDELVRIASLCAIHRVPLTVRGGGTGNYGQAVPLHGGVVVDMTGLAGTVWIKPGAGRFEAGAKLIDIDRALRPEGWEMRLHPSTRAQATLGGFVAGGAGGIGSCTWGQLADPGAVIAAQVLTVEEEPRLIELRDREALKVLHAYGVNGIITEIEMPLAAWQPWAERIFAFPTLAAAARYGQVLTAAEGIAKKLVSVHDGRIPPMIRRLKPIVPAGQAMVIVMVSEPQATAAEDLAADLGGTVVFSRSNPDAEAAAFEGTGALAPLYEYTWNHTTLYAIKARPEITYLQVRFPGGRELDVLDELASTFGDEVIFHLEFQRRFGRIFVSSLPLVRFSTVERLNEIIAIIEAAGAALANPHTYRLDGAGWKQVDAPQSEFRRFADPHGLMNPGKLG